MQIRFATWNIGCGAKGFHGRNPIGLANAILEQEIDICVLQEVDAFARRSNFVDFPATFKAGTGYHTHYCVSVPFAPEGGVLRRDFGNLLLSRYPITQVETAVFETEPSIAQAHSAEVERRTAILAEVDVGGEPLWCGGTHLAYSPNLAPSAIRRTQAAALADTIAKRVPKASPMALGGDFNSGIDSADIAALKSVLFPVTTEIRATWPIGSNQGDHTEPFIAIDHIFARGYTEARTTVVDYPELTDHALVIADFTFQLSKLN